MAWGAIAGAALSSAASFGSQLFGSAKSYKQNAAMMGLEALLSYYYQRQLNRNAYQDTTYSMRQAGINPMLAIGNGASAGSVSVGLNSANGPSGVDLDLTNALATAKQVKNDTQRVENETNMNEQNIAKSKADQALANEQLKSTQLQNDAQSIQNKYAEKTAQQNLINTQKQGQLIDAQKLDYVNQIKNRNLTTNSAIDLNNSTKKYTDERSRGFSYTTRGLGFEKSTTGNESALYSSAKGFEKSVQYEYINGHKVPVTTFSKK